MATEVASPAGSPRYQRIELKNSRCLRDVHLELEPLTVLVGPTGAGKTAVVEALMGRLGYPWQGRKDVEVSIAAHDTDGRVFYRADRNAEDFIVDRPRALPVDTHLLLRLDATAIRQPNQLARELRLATDGGNLANVFASLKRAEQVELVEMLRQLVPTLADVDTDPTRDGFHRLVVQDAWVPELWYPPEEISDGTLLMLALLMLRFHAPRISLVAIENPERGLHPWQLARLMTFLRALSTGQLGAAPMQIVLTTHAAELLEHVQPEELRLLSRADDGATVVTRAPLDDLGWRRFFALHRGSLASAWLSGALGGVPGRGGSRG